MAAREAGWPGYLEAGVFAAVLAAALAYVWKVGGLDWGPRGARATRGGRRQPDAMVSDASK